MENGKNKRCNYCGEPFQGKHELQQFCCHACQESYQNENLLRDLFRQCELSEANSIEPQFSLGEFADKRFIKHFDEQVKRLQRIQDFWLFCHATFWYDKNFSEEEQNHFHRLIAKYFDPKQDSESNFNELIERACALKLYFNTNRDTKIPSPEEWLKGNSYCNLKCSKMWHMDFLHKLSSNATFVIGAKYLAEAYQNFTRYGNLLEITALRQKLIKHRQAELLQIFMNAVFHYQYVSH